MTEFKIPVCNKCHRAIDGQEPFGLCEGCYNHLKREYQTEYYEGDLNEAKYLRKYVLPKYQIDAETWRRWEIEVEDALQS